MIGRILCYFGWHLWSVPRERCSSYRAANGELIECVLQSESYCVRLCGEDKHDIRPWRKRT